MKRAHDGFLKMMKGMDIVAVIYHHTLTINAPIGLDFMLRWQWVQSVSALDKLIHDLIRAGMVEIFQGKRPKTKKYGNFSIDMDTYNELLGNKGAVDVSFLAQTIFEKRVIAVHKKNSYQDAEHIADGLACIWNEPHKWQVIADYLAMPEKNCKTKLNIICSRRNQIVHQCDCQDSTFEPQELFNEDIIDIKQFILNLGSAIYNCVKL